MYTCAHAHARVHTHSMAHTHRQTHTQMMMMSFICHRRSPSPTRTLCLCCCQIKAWKSGHKGDCAAAARADTRTAANTCNMHLNEYVKAVAYFEAQHALAISLKLAHLQSDAALKMGVTLTFASSQLGRAVLLVLTKLLDRIVTRLHWRAWMIKRVSWPSGFRLPSMVVVHFQTCTCSTSPFMRAKRMLAGTSQRAPLVALATGTWHLRRVLANAGQGHANAHVQWLQCSEVLLRR